MLIKRLGLPEIRTPVPSWSLLRNSTKLHILLFSTICVVLGGCSSPSVVDLRVSDESTNAIAVCSAGLKVKVSAGLKSQLSSILKGDGQISVEAQNEIKGIFLNEAQIRGGDAAKVYEKYIDCVNRNYTPKPTACLKNCDRIFEIQISSLEDTKSICMEVRRKGCMEECQSYWKKSFADCGYDHCDPTKDSNKSAWGRRCKSDVATDSFKHRKELAQCKAECYKR